MRVMLGETSEEANISAETCSVHEVSREPPHPWPAVGPLVGYVPDSASLIFAETGSTVAADFALTVALSRTGARGWGRHAKG